MAPLLSAADDGTENVRAELVAEVASIRPGQPFRVGVLLKMAPHWHTYWRNPGDSGLATTLTWDLPDGFRASDITWPVPAWLEVEGLVSFGYEDEVLLPVTITPPGELEAGGEVELRVQADWLECKEMCLPGGAALSLALPVGDGRAATGETATRFAETDRSLPVDGSDWQVAVTRRGQQVRLSAKPPEGIRAAGEDLTFFPFEEGVFELARTARRAAAGDDVVEFDLVISEAAEAAPSRVSGVLVAGEGWKGLDGRPAVAIAGPVEEGMSSAPVTPAAGTTLPAAIALAFVGGLILNLMPCVFPVISLKILGFVQLAESDPRKVWRHGLVFAAGVVVSFWGLAGLLLVLKAAGQAIGWGFQLQAPGFVAAMAMLFLLIALSLLGVFEVGGSLMGLGGRAQAQEGWTGSFLSGVLATVVATPCTAPFMGAALGFALTQPAWVSMTVFTALGVGMAVPYLVLSRFPGWLSRIPRPGPWMESMKQGMGFLVLGFTLFLVWVFAGQRGQTGLGSLLVGLLIVAAGAWVLGRWGSVSRSPRSRLVARVLAGLCLVGGYALAVQEPAATGWEPYSAERLAALREEGEPVFIDFTADWCVTCQLNKKVALNREHVQEAFRKKGVTLLKADFSDRSEEILEVLEGYGRSGVPTYVLYGRGADAEPRLLPEALTAGTVLQALDDL